MINVAILLSTYNGARFLKVQIDSLLAQSYKNWDLYIRDDGSTDGTPAIIDYYTSNYTNIHFLKDQSKNKGASQSFMWILEEVEANYYMFCDQDDFWLPGKIEITLNAMKDLESYYPELPLLVHTDLIVTDSNLQEISASFWKYARLKQNYLTKFKWLGVCNGVTGCAMMINNKAKKIAIPTPFDAPMHDYWVALRVAQQGKISFIAKPTILYRQHAKNEVGAQNTNYNYFIQKIKHFSTTIKNQLKQHTFLKELGYGNLLTFYWYKLKYTIIRNI
ncbi:glycosyltransferase family 2 protein [Chryseobacterium sp. SC28]|uniref:glycosyltransferase family 2 protein n=1 Tax=Chryseobacterium sp. SC28 TaxID=2268028 RepID=UPI000F6514CA|nr:glycosyltransferase family 2 protein [Chryseobacterium sp. SC28]RRQ45334.1 glycosyltransferase family 2 protein [Chryseobacterium sp. SC28]